MGRLWIVMCFVCVAVGVCGCNLDKDYSMRSGSYQAENWKGKEFMRMRFYREGITTPRFFVGKMERLHGGQDTLFEVGGIWTIKQHVLIMVGLDDDMVGSLQKGLYTMIRFTAVGHNHESLVHIINHIPHAVGRVMADAEGSYLHAK